MSAELGKAYVQIVPSAKGISGSISSAIGGEATSAGQSAGFNIAGAIKTAIAAAGIGTAIKSALDAGANLQQSYGGLDTLYGDAADQAKRYAAEAAAAGISANTYAEQAVSFGAALKQAYGGDTEAAMEAANLAILDMADNSAKMGTDIQSIQNAYAGISKQNYSMLDNLKIGYQGSRSEMERLLADAEKLTGVHYDIDNLGDVYSAIHVIQEDLGLTGVAAEEAKTTFSGSMGAMKAAAENLMANIALGEDIGPSLQVLGQTIQTFVLDNLLPMLGNIFESIPELLSGLSSIIIGMLNILNNNPDELVQTGISIVTSLVSAIVEAAPYLVEAAWNLIAALGSALINTDWASVGRDLISRLRSSVDLAAGEILGMDSATIDGFLSGITSALPSVLESGSQMILELLNGILGAIPDLIMGAGELLNTFTTFFLENAPTVMEAGVNLILDMVKGITDSLPDITASAQEVISTFLTNVADKLPDILAQGGTLLLELVTGIIEALPDLVIAVGELIGTIVTTLDDYDWLEIGKNILLGIKDGLLSILDALADAITTIGNYIWDGICDYFGISSPAKLTTWAGAMLDEGLALGIKNNTDVVDDAVNELTSGTAAQFEMTPQFGEITPLTQTSTQQSSLDRLLALLEEYLPQLADGSNVNVTLEGDAEGLFNIMRSQNRVYRKMNGESAFA